MNPQTPEVRLKQAGDAPGMAGLARCSTSSSRTTAAARLSPSLLFTCRARLENHTQEIPAASPEVAAEPGQTQETSLI